MPSFNRIHLKLPSPEQFSTLNSKSHDFVWDDLWPMLWMGPRARVVGSLKNALLTDSLSLNLSTADISYNSWLTGVLTSYECMTSESSNRPIREMEIDLTQPPTHQKWYWGTIELTTYEFLFIKCNYVTLQQSYFLWLCHIATSFHKS